MVNRRAIFANHRCRRAAAAPTTHIRTKLAAGHARCPGADIEASWDLDVGKKLSRNPRLSDQHQAVSRRPQNGMRSFPGERPLHAQSRPCKQDKPQHRALLALTSFIQHRSINSGDLAALWGRNSGMVRRYGDHARYTAAGSRFARSTPLHCC